MNKKLQLFDPIMMKAQKKLIKAIGKCTDEKEKKILQKELDDLKLKAKEGR